MCVCLSIRNLYVCVCVSCEMCLSVCMKVIMIVNIYMQLVNPCPRTGYRCIHVRIRVLLAVVVSMYTYVREYISIYSTKGLNYKAI